MLLEIGSVIFLVHKLPNDGLLVARKNNFVKRCLGVNYFVQLKKTVFVSRCDSLGCRRKENSRTSDCIIGYWPFAFLLLMTTRWTDLMAGLRALHLPSLFISVLNMAYRYIFLIEETGSSMMQARYLRTVGRISARSGRQYMGNSFGRIFVSVHSFSENIYDAMVLRGYDGTPRTMRCLKIQAADWLFLLINIIILMILTVGGYIFG